MEIKSRENPVFGRKIFFANPSLFIENYVLDFLKEHEYEVYVISDFHKARNILARYPDSICFIDIDSELSVPAWYEFVKSLESDPSLSSIFIGVMSETAKFDIREKFMMNLKLPSGFIMIDKKTTGFMEDLQKVLDINGAKGRRQYLRLDTKEMSEVSAYLTFDQKLFTVDVNDISSVGFAVKFSPNLQNVFKKNTLINNICLSLEKRSFVCSCIVFNVMVLQNGSHVAVLMLTNQNPKEIKNSIRSFIFEKLDRDMAEVIKISDSDNIHYRDSGEFDKLTAVRTEAADNSKVNAGDGGYHSSMDDIGDVEDLEEI